MHYLRLIERIRAARPDILLTSDFIVGFPGETDADFQATLDLIRAVGFGMAYSFKYSARPGTPAAEKPPVADDMADARLQELQALITAQQRAAQEAMVGREVSVLYEKPGRLPGQMVGKSQHLMAVHVDDAQGRIGDLVRVRVVSIGHRTLCRQCEFPIDAGQAVIISAVGGDLQLSTGYCGWAGTDRHIMPQSASNPLYFTVCRAAILSHSCHRLVKGALAVKRYSHAVRMMVGGAGVCGWPRRRYCRTCAKRSGSVRANRMGCLGRR